MPTLVPGMNLYLYGDRDPQILASMSEPGFHHLVLELFDREEAVLPEPNPPVLRAAVEGGLLELEGERYRPGPKLVLIPAGAEESALQLMRPALAHYVEIAGDVTRNLARIYPECAAARLFPWETVVHTLVAGMFLDLAMGVQIHRSGEIVRGPIGDSVVWAFERMSGRNGYGVQWFPGSSHRAFVAQLWHWDVRRRDLRLTKPMVDLLLEVATAGDENRTQEEPASPKDLLYLRYIRFLAKEGSGYTLQVPVFGPNDTGRLLPILERGARRLVEDAIAPALEALGFNRWWEETIRQDPYRHAAVRLALEYGIDGTIGSTVLPPFPRGECPLPWGRWIWVEDEGPQTLIPSVAARQRQASDG